ncbi:MAG TPA: DNA polymerase III subunit gamma/tau [Solirubrobacteraceae bacterium]|nr:DNA polymerase III subunit gamma/tau [Solirubrobacteraceae bacterium]
MPPVSASLYRRHRPRSFADVVGQEHVVRTLRNAIEQDRVHHAYLFVGSRGTGKTSMAKILAASLNCERGGPTVQPCGVCDSCRSIADATSLDVIEMDAASNNSVDDIRDLREKVAYAPVSGRHKVYILDEAHMLTPAAWNAFLKTLEEPPPHTVFVLATTEANKVLPTVVDRCHRFDFSRPNQRQISSVLLRAAEAETLAIPDEAIALIARSATGSFRDALGTLEQLVSYSGTSIALDDVLAVLGAADADLLFGCVDAVDGGDARGALLAAARLADSGRDIGRFFGDLEAHLRALMVVQTLGEVPAEIAVTAEQDQRLAEQAGRVGPATVLRLLDLIALAQRACKDGADARTQLELALVKGARPEHDPSLRALMARMERLEAGRPAPAATPVRDPAVPATPAARAAVATSPPPAPAQPAAVAPPPEPAPAPAPAPEPAADPAAVVAAGADVEGAPAVTAVAVVEADGTVSEPVVHIDGDLDLDSVAELWPAVLDDLRERRPMLHAALEHARPSQLADKELTIAWAQSADFYRRKAEEPACREQIADAIRSVTGSSLRLAYALAEEHELPRAGAVPSLSDDELIDRFMREFDAEELPAEEES